MHNDHDGSEKQRESVEEKVSEVDGNVSSSTCCCTLLTNRIRLYERMSTFLDPLPGRTAMHSTSGTIDSLKTAP